MSMAANIVLPKKEIFLARSQAIGANVDKITQSNRMAKLLVDNFRGWVSSAAVSPLELTVRMDKDQNGLISGSEFADLLGTMTGERPPDWVTELMFSFAGASPDIGIAVGEWLALLAALGVEVPDDLFASEAPLTGAISIEPEGPHRVDETLTVKLSFSRRVEGYVLVVEQDGSQDVERLSVPPSEMDGGTFDDLELTPDEADRYTLHLMHGDVRLATSVIDVRGAVLDPAPVVAVEPEQPQDPIEPADVEVTAPDVASPSNLADLVDHLAGCKLRSEAMEAALAAPLMNLHGVVVDTSTTLLGPEGYRNSETLVVQAGAHVVEVMMKTAESYPGRGAEVKMTVRPNDWSLARRRMVALEH
jgi:hypothetical protein